MNDEYQNIEIRALLPEDAPWVMEFLQEHWHSAQIVSRGRVHQGHELPGFVATRGESIIGLVTYRIEDEACEIVTLNSLIEGVGIGTELIKEVLKTAVEKRCKRAWAVTTNDNLNALRFYQTRGFVLSALYRNAVEGSRQLKPEIPERGFDGIPIRDEVEVEMVLI